MGAYGYAKTALNEQARIVVDQFIADNDCSLFDTFNRVDHKRKWRKVWTVPCDEYAKNEGRRLAQEQNISEKEVVNILLFTYLDKARDAGELVEMV